MASQGEVSSKLLALQCFPTSQSHAFGKQTRLMDAEVERVMSRYSKLNRVNAVQVAQARSLNTVQATPTLNRLCNLNGWDLKTCLS